MNIKEQQKNSFIILMLCIMAFLLSGCKWFNDNDNPEEQDTTAPIITLVGDNPQNIELGLAYTELGATAVDNEDGDITANIVIDATAVDINTVGNYSVTYNVADAAGNAAATVTRTVEVVGDLTPPVITLTGDNPQVIEYGTAYTELGASASDNQDGDISANIIIDASAVDTNTLGSYSVTYDVSDAAGNAAVTLTRTVNVVDTTAPVISLIGENPQAIELNGNYTELGATATDNHDGDISANIMSDTSAVDTTTVGTYSVTYNVSDAAGNAATTATRTVNVGATQAKTFIVANDGTNGDELFTTDGTEAGTLLLKNIRTGTGNGSNPGNFFTIGSILYFTAYTDATGYELWKSDGTETGTVLVKDIRPGSDGSVFQDITPMANINGTLFFIANNGTHGGELWKSDGTEDGTVMVKDINTGAATGIDYSHTSTRTILEINGLAYFLAEDADHGKELWKSDGTEDGTVMVKDIYPGTEDSFPSYLIALNNKLYFSAVDDTNGAELWTSDGTESGTVIVKDLLPGPSSSAPARYYEHNGLLYFVARDNSLGRELWKSDGTEAGTVMVKDIFPGLTDSYPHNFISLGDTLMFTAGYTFAADGLELWKTDGTEAGTVRVKDINSGGGSTPQEMVGLDNIVLFIADDGIHGRELWKSDGTDAGTVLVTDLVTGADHASLILHHEFNHGKPIILEDNRILFGYYDATYGYTGLQMVQNPEQLFLRIYSLELSMDIHAN